MLECVLPEGSYQGRNLSENRYLKYDSRKHDLEWEDGRGKERRTIRWHAIKQLAGAKKIQMPGSMQMLGTRGNRKHSRVTPYPVAKKWDASLLDRD